jgi:hypothetical protein
VRVRSLLVTAIVVAAATSCSEAPAPDAAADGNARSSTVLPSGDDARTPIASPEEANLPPEAPPTRREATASPARPLPGVADGAAEAAARPAGEGAAVAASAEGAESDAAQPQDVASVGGGTGKPRTALNEGPIRDPYNPGRPGVVIIRGGNPRIDDDCAIHPSVRDVGLIGAAGVAGGSLIGDILPPGGALINDRGPTPAAVGADPTARGGTVLNNPDPRRGSGVTGGIGMPARGGAAVPSRGGMPRRGIR